MSSKGQAEEYIAFISYRHKPLDKSAAERIQRSIEGYKVPPELRDQAGGKRLGRVFRDEDELPASPNLTAAIKYALDHSRFLITICTRSFPGSRWCEEEVRYFLEHHDRDHILAVLVEGDPEESFSKYLRYTYDEDGNITGGAEPLAANIAGGNKTIDNRIYHREITRLIAALIGCSFDALWQREKRNRTNRLMALMGLGTAVMAAFLFLTISKNREITAQSDALVRQYSTVSVDSGMNLLEEYDPDSALEIGRASLLGTDQADLYDHRAIGLVNKALGSYQYRKLRSRIVCHQETDFTDLTVLEDGTSALVLDAQGILQRLDLYAGADLWTAKIGSLAGEETERAAFLPAQSLGMVLCKKGRAISALSLEDGSELWNWSFINRDPAAAWCLSPDQKTLLVVSCPDDNGSSALLTGLDPLNGAELGSVELTGEDYQMLLEREDPAFSMGLAFSDDSSQIGCAFYGARIEDGETDIYADCIYKVFDADSFALLHEYVVERDAEIDFAVFLGIKPEPEKDYMQCVQYDATYGAILSTCMDWKADEHWQVSDPFRLRARSGDGLPDGIEKSYRAVPMLYDERLALAFLDNGFFVYDRERGNLQKTYLFNGRILGARWLNYEEKQVEVLVEDGSICVYDFPSDIDFEAEAVEMSVYDQDGLRLAVPIRQGLRENREGFIYLTVREEAPGQILGVERISDLTLESLAGPPDPDLIDLTSSGEKLFSWTLGDLTSVTVTDTRSGQLLEQAAFKTPGEPGVPTLLNETSFLYQGKICSMDGSVRDLELPDGYSLDYARDILSIRMTDGRVLTAANLCLDSLPHLNLCWINGDLVEASTRWNRNLAFKTCSAFAAGENGWYTGYGICRTENGRGVETVTGSPCFGAFHADSGKRVLIPDPCPDAETRTLAVGTRDPIFACIYNDGSIALGSFDSGTITMMDASRIPGDIQALCFSEGDRYLLALTSSGRLYVISLKDGGLYFFQNVDLYGRSPSDVTGMSCRENEGLGSLLILLHCKNEAGGPWIQLDAATFSVIGEADHIGAQSSEAGRIYACTGEKLLAFPIHTVEDLRKMADNISRR